MADAMVQSEIFPNLMVAQSIKPALDTFLRDLKNSPDSAIQNAVSDLERLQGYQIKNGSPEGECIGSNNSRAHTIYLPQKLDATYTGSDGKQHRETFAGMAAHELIGHALGYDRKPNEMNAELTNRLYELAMDDKMFVRGAGTPAQAAESHPRFPAGAAHEAGAVAVENYVTAALYNNQKARNNVSDRNPSFTVDDLRQWEQHGYPIKGSCNGVPLSREPVAVNNDENKYLQMAQANVDAILKTNPEHAEAYFSAKKLVVEQAAGMAERDQNVVVARFNMHAAEIMKQADRQAEAQQAV